MNDLQICELIAKKPRIRATELANHFNVELTVVSSSLRSLVDVGDLVKSKQFDDNGRQSQVYELSDEFRKSREGKVLLERVLGSDDPKPALPIAVPDAVAPTQDDNAAPRPSKVQLALDCIAKLGAATDPQLRAAMGLPEKTYVGAYLASAVKGGKVMRDGEHWKLGSGKVEPGPAKHDSVVKVSNIAVVTKDAGPIPHAVINAVVAGPDLLGQMDAETVPELKCALWSDGTFELRSDGYTVAQLTDVEIKFVMAYMATRAAA